MVAKKEYIQGIFWQHRMGTDFSRAATELKNSGIQGVSYHVASGDTVYYGKDGETLLLPGGKKKQLIIASDKNLAYLSYALRTYQAGLTKYSTFCEQIASAGVNLWIADLSRMTISYFTASGYLLREECIPAFLPSDIGHTQKN
ncbi:hypothetical protein D3C81_424070 [compost metagenome]|uniref:DUF1398 family protein n=1 Tax=Kluyvera intermedia TaxID=61648 RepID=UPI000FB729BF